MNSSPSLRGRVAKMCNSERCSVLRAQHRPSRARDDVLTMYVLAPRTRCMRHWTSSGSMPLNPLATGHHSSSTTSTSRPLLFDTRCRPCRHTGAEHARYEARKADPSASRADARGYGRTKVCRACITRVIKTASSPPSQPLVAQVAASDTSITPGWISHWRSDRPEERHLQDDEEARRRDGTIRMIHRKVGACGCNSCLSTCTRQKIRLHAPVR
jgi:hypothetical protein